MPKTLKVVDYGKVSASSVLSSLLARKLLR